VSNPVQSQRRRAPAPAVAAQLGRLHGRYLESVAARDAAHAALCAELAAVRDREQMSVRELAALLGVSPSAVQHWLTEGRRRLEPA
jgi:DNA-binding transcriptional regulator YiaG